MKVENLHDGFNVYHQSVSGQNSRDVFCAILKLAVIKLIKRHKHINRKLNRMDHLEKIKITPYSKGAQYL